MLNSSLTIHNNICFPDYQSLRNVPLIRLLVSFILSVPLISCLVIVDQLDLEIEPAMGDFDTYLENYVGDSDQLTLLLDYDGTLAPIAAHPNLTVMSAATKASLDRIAENGKIFTAIISGRAVDDAKRKVGIDGIIYAGNHGLEILYPNGTRYNHQIPGNISGNFSKMIEALEKVSKIKARDEIFFYILLSDQQKRFMAWEQSRFLDVSLSRNARGSARHHTRRS